MKIFFKKKKSIKEITYKRVNFNFRGVTDFYKRELLVERLDNKIHIEPGGLFYIDFVYP